MHIAFLTTRKASAFADLTAVLEREGITWATFTEDDGPDDLARGPHDILIIDMAGSFTRPAAVRELSAACHKDIYIPVLALLHSSQLREIDASLGLDDFALLPAEPSEIIARLSLLYDRHRARSTNEDEINVGDLRINLARYEVWVGARQVTLTFKEYELLRVLASRPGHVFTRNTLLDVVWGYDYFGGTRTVDVHVRRLRSKIEDPTHTFVETVRNVGYRLRPD